MTWCASTAVIPTRPRKELLPLVLHILEQFSVNFPSPAVEEEWNVIFPQFIVPAFSSSPGGGYNRVEKTPRC